jgi:uncharacterized membrane protein YozB (DUF420 family)
MLPFWPIALHAGTPPVVSQTIMTVMFVSLGILLMGIGYEYIGKSKENLLQHRWALSAAVALTLGAIFLGMLPSFIRYYADSDVQFFSALSGTTLLHAVVSIPAIVLGTAYAFGRLPKKNLKKWMRLTAAFWIASIVIGVVLFLQMFNLLPGMPQM